MNIHEFLRKRREKAKITQKKLATALGVTEMYISNVEKGKAPPSLKRMGAWCDFIRAPRKMTKTIMIRDYKIKLNIYF